MNRRGFLQALIGVCLAPYFALKYDPRKLAASFAKPIATRRGYVEIARRALKITRQELMEVPWF